MKRDSDKKSVTINDVARVASVSNATVSRYLNNKTFINEEKAKKINEAIRKLNYSPNRIARGLKMNHSLQIVMVVPDVSNPFYSEVYKTVQKLANAKNYTVILFNSEDQLDMELEALRMVRELGGDGLIFCSTNDHDEVIRELLTLKIPVVASNTFGRLLFDTVHSKRGLSLYLSTSHLIDYGHKKIAYAGGNPQSILNTRRKSGYFRAMEENHLPTHNNFIFESEFTIRGGVEAGKYFSELHEMPTAVTCANDLIAMGLIQYFMNIGKCVPKDLSVVGMDNIEYASFCNPSITTINNDSAEFAENATNLLFSRILGKYSGSPREILNTRTLIIRESTARLQQEVEG